MFSRYIRLLQVVCLCFCGCILLPLTFSSQAHAASRMQFTHHSNSAINPITILSQSDTINFPKSIDFHISVRDTGSSIISATIIIASQAPRYVNELHSVPIDQPAAAATLQWHEDTSDSHFFPPGTHVTYYWQFQDSLNTYNEPMQSFDVNDGRFNWQNASQNLVQVKWYNRPTDFGQLVLTQALTSIQHISANLGGGLSHPLTLWVYQSDSDFRGALPPSAHEWVGGIAFISINQALIVVQDAQDDTLRRDMPHELAHLVFHQLTAQGIYAPIWFDEGQAIYNQLYQEPDMEYTFKQALKTHSLLRLDTLYAGFPADANQAYLAYAQSWQLLTYMYQTFGVNKMDNLIKSMNNDQLTFEQDLIKNLGEDQIHLENQWHISLQQPPVLLPIGTILTPQPAPKPITIQVLTDANAPLLTALGGTLVFLALSGMIVLFVYQRRSRQRILSAAQAQYVFNMTLPPRNGSVNSMPYVQPYTNPAAYMTPEQRVPYPPYQPYGQHYLSYDTPPAAPFGAYPHNGTNMPQPAPMVYPTPTPNNKDENTIGPVMPYQQAQEYNGQPPEKPAPQE